MDSTNTVLARDSSVLTVKAVCAFSRVRACLVCCIVPCHCVEQRGWFSVLLHIIVGCHLKPPRFAPLYKTLLWFLCDKPGGERERRRESEWDTPLKAPGLSPLSPPGNMPAFPKTLVLRGSSPCCPPPSDTGERDVEIYVMVTQSLPLLNSPSPLTAWERERETLGGEGEREGCWCFCRTEVDWDTMFSFCCFYLIRRGCSDLCVFLKCCVSSDMCVHSHRCLISESSSPLYLGLSGINSHGWLREDLWHLESRRSCKHIHT